MSKRVHQARVPDGVNRLLLELEPERVSYRMLDHWIRTKAITLCTGYCVGSGMDRTFTPAEAEAVKRFAARYRRLQADLEDMRSGAWWKREMEGQQ